MSDYTKGLLVEFIAFAVSLDGPSAITRLKQNPAIDTIRMMLEARRKENVKQIYYDDLKNHQEECAEFYAGILECAVVVTIPADDDTEGDSYLHN